MNHFGGCIYEIEENIYTLLKKDGITKSIPIYYRGIAENKTKNKVIKGKTRKVYKHEKPR